MTLEIHDFNQMEPGKVYGGGIPPISLSERQVQFGAGMASSEKQFKFTLQLLGKDGKSNDTLPDTALNSVELTMNPKSGTGKTIGFSNVQLSQANKMTEILTLLSEDEVAPYTEGDYMQLTIKVVYDKPEESSNENEKAPACNTLLSCFSCFSRQTRRESKSK